MRSRYVCYWLAVLCAVLVPAPAAHGHGLVGKRFFPATLATDDPFVADELSLPTVRQIKRRGSGDRPPTLETDVSGEFSKRLSPNLGLGLGGTWIRLSPDESHGAHSVSGFDNVEVALKYVFSKNPEHELLTSVGVGWDVGGTGSKKHVDAELVDTLTPQLFFGKGFGDLPDALDVVKPLALTGVFGVAVPLQPNTRTIRTDPVEGTLDIDREFHPKVARWGFTVQYSLQYLQSFVRDVGLPKPLSRMVPIVELAMQTPLEGPTASRTTGTINPGVIWFGRYVQLGIEAVIPVNERTGKNVGVLGQVHFFLDDILPKVFSWTPFHGTLGPAVPR